jgi:hypothetical protein
MWEENVGDVAMPLWNRVVLAALGMLDAARSLRGRSIDVLFACVTRVRY